MDAVERILQAAVQRGASDLHVKAGDVFRARIAGQLVPLTKQALTPEQTKAIALRLISNADDRARIDTIHDYDCSWGAPGIGRFRINILRQRSSFMIVLRVMPFEVPSVERLTLPPVLRQIAEAERGIILVSGGAGSGTSTTMAAMIHHLNQHHHKHIVTLEGPIEFLHRDLQGSVTQREVGVDTDSFRSGLHAALRQDPDVVLLGALHDAEAMDTALRVAESGHLLISAMPTADAPSTLRGLLDMFPLEEQQAVRVRLAAALHAVVSQRLLPRKDGNGQVAVLEILMATAEVRTLLRDGGPMTTLDACLAAGGDASGMQTFDQHLEQLVRADVLDLNVALAASTRPSELAHTFSLGT